MTRQQFIAAEFPLLPGPTLDPTPFTAVQLRAFELHANGLTWVQAREQAYEERVAAHAAARRARRRAVLRHPALAVAVLLVVHAALLAVLLYG